LCFRADASIADRVRLTVSLETKVGVMSRIKQGVCIQDDNWLYTAKKPFGSKNEASRIAGHAIARAVSGYWTA
jgi:hypothetical protein